MDFAITFVFVFIAVIVMMLAINSLINAFGSLVTCVRENNDGVIFLAIVGVITSLIVYTLPTLIALMVAMLLRALYLFKHPELWKNKPRKNNVTSIAQNVTQDYLPVQHDKSSDSLNKKIRTIASTIID